MGTQEKQEKPQNSRKRLRVGIYSLSLDAWIDPEKAHKINEDKMHEFWAECGIILGQARKAINAAAQKNMEIQDHGVQITTWVKGEDMWRHDENDNEK